MNSESFPTTPHNAEAGNEKRREVAEMIQKLYAAALEAAHELITNEGGVPIREKIVPSEKGKEAADHVYLATKLFAESLEEKRLAAEEQEDLEAARQLALAQDFSENHHGSVAAYLDARNSYPELVKIIETIYPNFPSLVDEAREHYGN